VQLKEKDDLKREDVQNLLISLPGGEKIPVSEVAKITVGAGPLVLEREDQQNVGYVSASLQDEKLGTIKPKITKGFSEIELPELYDYEFTGEMKDMQEAFASLGEALMIAIILIYMILVAQFQSLLQPFVIMLTLAMAIVGVALGLMVTFTSFNIMVFLGLIVLAGIVVNNAIVLIDYINQLRGRGYSRQDAILEGARVRLRPILLTTLTTVFGMSPLALGFGSGSEFYQPLAITIISGLLFSTLLTLIFIPVMYTLFDDFTRWVKRRLKISVKEEPESAGSEFLKTSG